MRTAQRIETMQKQVKHLITSSFVIALEILFSGCGKKVDAAQDAKTWKQPGS
jgi:hypothetical protein